MEKKNLSFNLNVPNNLNDYKVLNKNTCQFDGFVERKVKRVRGEGEGVQRYEKFGISSRS